jgi:hypothetical protein
MLVKRSKNDVINEGSTAGELYSINYYTHTTDLHVYPTGSYTMLCYLPFMLLHTACVHAVPRMLFGMVGSVCGGSLRTHARTATRDADRHRALAARDACRAKGCGRVGQQKGTAAPSRARVRTLLSSVTRGWQRSACGFSPRSSVAAVHNPLDIQCLRA